MTRLWHIAVAAVALAASAAGAGTVRAQAPAPPPTLPELMQRAAIIRYARHAHGRRGRMAAGTVYLPRTGKEQRILAAKLAIKHACIRAFGHGTPAYL